MRLLWQATGGIAKFVAGRPVHGEDIHGHRTYAVLYALGLAFVHMELCSFTDTVSVHENNMNMNTVVVLDR